MPAVHEVRRLPWSAEQMFDLVADVARYGEFLPWVVATRVRSDDGHEMIADMLVGFRMLREKFTSRVIRERPSAITVQYIDGPMRDLDNHWRFEALPEGGCSIDFSVRFAFRNALFESLAGQYFDRAFRKMVAAFEARAEVLYGGGKVASGGAGALSGNSNSSATKTA